MAASNPSCGRIGSTPARSDLPPRVPTRPPPGLICARPSCAACASFGRQPSRSPTPWIATPPGWDVLLPPSTTDRPPLDLPATLPPRDLARTAFALTGAEGATQARALACYVTQQQEMPTLLAAFVRSTEPFSVLTDALRTHGGEMIEQAVRQPSR